MFLLSYIYPGDEYECGESEEPLCISESEDKLETIILKIAENYNTVHAECPTFPKQNIMFNLNLKTPEGLNKHNKLREEQFEFQKTFEETRKENISKIDKNILKYIGKIGFSYTFDINQFRISEIEVE